MQVTSMASSGFGDFTLLLVGTNENCNSSVGNSILGKKSLTSSGNSAPPRVGISRIKAEIDGQEITVVDIPGIASARFDNYESIKGLLDQVTTLFSLCHDGFSSVLIVLKYRAPYTQQDIDAIVMIKTMFGPDVVRKYGVIVMSHGDSFELDMEDEKTSFEDWYKEQTGDIKALFTECDNRCVLFNTRTKEREKRKVQYESLMSKVASIHHQFGNYTFSDYEEVEEGRRRLTEESKRPELTCSTNVNELNNCLQQEDEDKECAENPQMKITKMAVTNSWNLTLLLIGRTGNGKSSTGNSILGRKPFTPRGSTAAVISEIVKETAYINGQEITVVDGPGIGDASFDNYKDIKATLTQVEKALELCGNGFGALLIVLKYKIGFTQQEKDAITMINSIFGPDVVRKYGIIVMSHGDSFELDTEDEGTSFEDWCEEQTGDVKALFTECDNRCVLFNNREKDLDKQKAQLDSLVSKVNSICSQSKNYTLEHYKEAERERTKLLVRSKLPQMEEKIEKGLDEIKEKLNQVGNDNSEASVSELNTCTDDIIGLKSYLREEDQNTGCTEELQMRIKLVETTVQMKLRRIQAQRPEHEEMGNSQGGGSGIFSSLSGAVTNDKSKIPFLSRVVDTARPYVHFVVNYVTEKGPDMASICDDQSAVLKD